MSKRSWYIFVVALVFALAAVIDFSLAYNSVSAAREIAIDSSGERVALVCQSHSMFGPVTFSKAVVSLKSGESRTSRAISGGPIAVSSEEVGCREGVFPIDLSKVRWKASDLWTEVASFSSGHRWLVETDDSFCVYHDNGEVSWKCNRIEGDETLSATITNSIRDDLVAFRFRGERGERWLDVLDGKTGTVLRTRSLPVLTMGRTFLHEAGRTMAYSKDGRFVALHTQAGKVFLFSIPDPSLDVEIEAPNCTALCFCGNERLLVAIENRDVPAYTPVRKPDDPPSGELRLFDLSGKLHGILPARSYMRLFATPEADRIIASHATDREVDIWSLNRNELKLWGQIRFEHRRPKLSRL